MAQIQFCDGRQLKQLQRQRLELVPREIKNLEVLAKLQLCGEGF